MGFSPDDGSDRLIVASADGVIREYLLNDDELFALARSRVTRPLTTEECQKYLHLEQCPAD